MDPVTKTTPQPVEVPHRGRGRLELLREIEELKAAKLRLEAEIAELKVQLQKLQPAT